MVKTGNGVEIVLAGMVPNRISNMSGGIYDVIGKSPTLHTRCDQTYITTNEATYRKLTPIECERLQISTDDYTKYGIMNEKTVEISNAQRYKMIGVVGTCIWANCYCIIPADGWKIELLIGITV